MKNKTITLYELLGLIKDGKAPKKIKYYDKIYTYIVEEKMYYDEDEISLWKYYNGNILNDAVEILPEENDEWEDIPIFKISDYKEIFNQFQLDIFKQINLIKKNQKYLKERIDKND